MPIASCGFPDEPDLLWKFGPTLNVQVGYDPEFKAGVTPRAVLPNQQYPALVDTGALDSCIDSLLAQSLGLQIVGRRMVSGAHGAHEVNMHLAQIYVPSLDYTIYGLFAGVHLVVGGQPHQALIGRTFLREFSLAYDGRTGAVTISN